jgi:hypothetical protein
MEKSLELFITKVLNITDTELKELIYETKEGATETTIKDDAGDLLVNKYADKAKKQKEELTAKFDQGYQKGQKELASKVKSLTKDKLSVDVDTEDIDELFEKTSEAINAKIKNKSTQTEDQVKNHEIYIKREKELNKMMDDLKASFETEKTTIISEYKKKENLSKIKEKAESVLIASGAVLSENPTIKKNQINVFLNQFNDFDFDFIEDEIIIKKGDKRLEDNLNNPVKFDSFVSEQAKSLFDFKVQDPKGGAGNQGGDPDPNIMSFKDHNDYMQKFENAPDLVTKQKIGLAWEKSPNNPNRK